MTHIDSRDGGAVLVRAADAEVIGFPPQTVRLLADSSSTGGHLSTQRVTLAGGADGANPHHHASSAELFYVLSGSVQLLAGDRVQDSSTSVTWPGSAPARSRARACLRSRPCTTRSSVKARPGSRPAAATGRLHRPARLPRHHAL
jgi:hypothetical protein